jgi:anti-anti-sigma factor
MSAVKKRKGDARALRIEGEMTIYRAAELKQVLLASLGEVDALEIDLSSVTEMDTAGVQLLIAAKKAAQAKQQELHLTGHSAAVLDVLEIFNLVSYFGDPVVMSSRPAPAHRDASHF